MLACQGDAAAEQTATAINNLYFLAFAHTQYTHTVLRIAFR